jgi:hypothetical protein
MRRLAIASQFGVVCLMAASLLVGPSIRADNGPNHQVRNQHFGVSGGNVNDISRAFCCSGTLGSLVKDSNNVQYILSNNHVLGRSDAAPAGEDISQPGLIDNGCRVATVVADFSVAPALGSNVDAAIAQLRAGQMDSTGFIEDIGTISSTVKAPTVGLAVAKSGRTTGFTTGSVGSVTTSVSVQYQKGCNQGKKFTISYTNQVVINSSTFSAGGDSGSLIVTDNACHQPVALLYAGSSSTTIGNPIGEVLTKLGTALGGGRTVSFVGGSTCSALTLEEPLAGISRAAMARAVAAKQRNEARLFARGGVIGVGIGASDEDSTEPVIVVYVDSNAISPRVPRRIEGMRVKRVVTDPFIAY